MPCNTPSGTTNAKFGIENDEEGLIIQSIKITKKRDKKELRNSCGKVIGVTYYNNTAEVEMEGVTKNWTKQVGDPMPLANGSVTGKLVIDEISIDMSNEDFVKTSVKGTAYEKILS